MPPSGVSNETLGREIASLVFVCCAGVVIFTMNVSLKR